VPLRLNPIYRTSNNLFKSWIPRKDSPEEGQLRCIRSYGIITPKKKRLGKQSPIFNGIFQTFFKPIPKSIQLRNLGTRFFLRGEGCNIQVVRQLDTPPTFLDRRTTGSTSKTMPLSFLKNPANPLL
jgi:hypothetical protein